VRSNSTCMHNTLTNKMSAEIVVFLRIGNMLFILSMVSIKSFS
jgi:hypothetical protein